MKVEDFIKEMFKQVSVGLSESQVSQVKEIKMEIKVTEEGHVCKPHDYVSAVIEVEL